MVLVVINRISEIKFGNYNTDSYEKAIEINSRAIFQK